jgi:hypothetical protein
MQRVVADQPLPGLEPLVSGSDFQLMLRVLAV